MSPQHLGASPAHAPSPRVPARPGRRQETSMVMHDPKTASGLVGAARPGGPASSSPREGARTGSPRVSQEFSALARERKGRHHRTGASSSLLPLPCRWLGGLLFLAILCSATAARAQGPPQVTWQDGRLSVHAEQTPLAQV